MFGVVYVAGVEGHSNTSHLQIEPASRFNHIEMRNILIVIADDSIGDTLKCRHLNFKWIDSVYLPAIDCSLLAVKVCSDSRIIRQHKPCINKRALSMSAL